jgi:hypothetical protein
MQSRKKFNKRFDPKTQNEIFFTMKVYAVKTNRGKIKSMKYSIDFHPPFEANTNTIEPFASPTLQSNTAVFHSIFDHVKELFSFISNPFEYNKVDHKKTQEFRLDEQKHLAEAIEKSMGAVNYITYEQNSPPILSVGTVVRTTGNGDMRPPKI